MSDFREKSCEGKRRYADKRAAVSEINFIFKRRHRHRPERLRAYPCKHCGGWHLTKRP